MSSAIVELVKTSIDVNEHDKSSNLILKQIKEKLQAFYCRSAFHSDSRVFNNDHNSYPKMSVKWHLAFRSAVGLRPYGFCWFHVVQFLVSVYRFVDHCLSFFFWPIHCLSFDIQLLISPLVSSNLSSEIMTIDSHIRLQHNGESSIITIHR